MTGVLLVGCGKMGGAMLDGWLKHPDLEIGVVEPGPAPVHLARPVAWVARPGDLPAGFQAETVVLAVKPQVMDDVLPAYRHLAAAGVPFVSIAAGKSLGYFADRLGATTQVVRAMPNLPASIGRGITVAVANRPVQAEARTRADRLLGACGAVEWVDDERLIDAVTAVSGGGPAYVFLLAEQLAEAGRAAGLPPALAERLARTTVAGAGALLDASELSAEALRRAVSSPGGTTLAALGVLMAEDGLQPLLTRAIAAATTRSRELSR